MNIFVSCIGLKLKPHVVATRHAKLRAQIKLQARRELSKVVVLHSRVVQDLLREQLWRTVMMISRTVTIMDKAARRATAASLETLFEGLLEAGGQEAERASSRYGEHLTI